jgi:hypothetical protein
MCPCALEKQHSALGLCNAPMRIAPCAMRCCYMKKPQFACFLCLIGGKAQKSYLNLEANKPINKDSCTHFIHSESWRYKATVRHPDLQGKAFSSSCCIWHVLQFRNDLGYHE